MSSGSPLGVRRALRLGFAQAVSLWQSVLLLFAAEVVEVLAMLWLAVMFFAAPEDSPDLLSAGLGATLVAWLFSRALHVFVLGGALRQGAQRMRRMKVDPLIAQGAMAAPRSFSYLAWSVLLQFLSSLWKVAVLVSALWLYFRALLEQEGGLIASIGLGLALAIVAPLGFFLPLWLEVALVRSVLREEGFLASLFDSVVVLLQRPGAYIALAAITGFIAWTINVALSGMLNVAGSWEAPSMTLGVAQNAAVGVVTAFVTTLFELTWLHAVSALTLDESGSLPREPILAIPIPLAEVVVAALPVPQPES